MGNHPIILYIYRLLLLFCLKYMYLLIVSLSSELFNVII